MDPDQSASSVYHAAYVKNMLKIAGDGNFYLFMEKATSNKQVNKC